MNERDYLIVRRAYNVVRQHCESDRRLTFEEYAILCRLDMINTNARVTEVASFQHALRPTMAHRMDHLEKRGLIMRGIVPDDRRATWVTLTADGVDVVKDLARQTLRSFPTDSSLRRVTVKRVERMVDAMGSVFLTAGDIIVLALMDEEEYRAQISALVDSTGFLQPTTSMAVSRLVESGLAERCIVKGSDGRRTTLAHLTDEGVNRAHELIELIEAITVRKERASKKGKAKAKDKGKGKNKGKGKSKGGAAAEAPVELTKPVDDAALPVESMEVADSAEVAKLLESTELLGE